ncbi:MAG: ABC transporter permease [Ilumatobacteraceae bacterium]
MTRLGGFLRAAIPPLLVLVVLVSVWWAAIRIIQPQAYIFPSPGRVWDAAITDSDRLWTGFRNTLYASVVGYLAATAVGVLASLVLSLSRTIERAFFPWAVLLQTVPAVAVAPLFVLWFGPGRGSVMLVAFTITLFPILANSLAGLRSADVALVDLIRLRGRRPNSLFTFTKIRIPSSMPYLFTGLRISAGLAVIGAIVGEIVVGRGGPEAGLGYWVTFGTTQLRTDFVFAAIAVSSALGITFFLTVSAIGNRVLHNWHESARDVET